MYDKTPGRKRAFTLRLGENWSVRCESSFRRHLVCITHAIQQLFSRKLHISVPGRSDFVVRRFLEQEVNDVAAASGLQAEDRNQWRSRLADTTENHHSDGTRQKYSLSSCNWTEKSEEKSNGTHGHMNNLPFMRNLLLILRSDFPHRHELAFVTASFLILLPSRPPSPHPSSSFLDSQV